MYFLTDSGTSGSQASISPNDVTILDSPTMMMNGDIRELVVGFVIGGKSGQGSPISSAHLEEIIQREGPNLARDMSAAVSLDSSQVVLAIHIIQEIVLQLRYHKCMLYQ